MQSCLDADGEAEARSPDLGHVVGSQNMPPASEASLGSQKRPPPLVHPAEDPSTPQKPSSQGGEPDTAAPGCILCGTLPAVSMWTQVGRHCFGTSTWGDTDVVSRRTTCHVLQSAPMTHWAREALAVTLRSKNDISQHQCNTCKSCCCLAAGPARVNMEALALTLGPFCANTDEWEFPQTPGSLTGPVSSKLWASPAVSPLSPLQVASDCPGVIDVEVRAACRLSVLSVSACAGAGNMQQAGLCSLRICVPGHLHGLPVA